MFNGFFYLYRGIKLIERNEEVCIFYEKVNIQGNILEYVDVFFKSL